MATRADYILPKAARVGCWILGSLIFYGLFTRQVLSGLAIRTHEELRFFSAWMTLGQWLWNEPGKIVNVGYYDFLDSLFNAIIRAVIGSVPMLILAIGRKRRLVGLLLCLSIPFAVIAVLFVQISPYNNIAIDKPINIFDNDLNNHDSFLSEGKLEWILVTWN